MIKSVMRLLLGVDILFLSYHKKRMGYRFSFVVDDTCKRCNKLVVGVEDRR